MTAAIRVGVALNTRIGCGQRAERVGLAGNRFMDDECSEVESSGVIDIGLGWWLRDRGLGSTGILMDDECIQQVEWPPITSLC